MPETAEELAECDAPEPKAVVAVEASAAVPATFANVRLDNFLLIKCSPRSSVLRINLNCRTPLRANARKLTYTNNQKLLMPRM